MTYRIQNLRGKTEAARQLQSRDTEPSAHHAARACSASFHGVWAISHNNQDLAYYVNGRKYLEIETAWTAR